MDRKQCTVCESQLNNIYNLKNVPIKLCCIDTPQYETSTMSFSQCKKCLTIQLDKLIPLNILYSGSHNQISVGKTWANYFDLFIVKINPIVKNKTVLEIGCPSGKIALRANNYNKWYIVEPNKNPDIIFPQNIEFIESYFDDNLDINSNTMDVIIHSHVFEHIYQSNKFLKKCAQLLCENGEMFFGVPNMEYFAETNLSPFLGIFFEHTIFLNKDNIQYLLNKNGFDIIDIIDYENHSTLYHCKKNTSINLPKSIIIKDYNNSFFQSVQYYTEFVEKCNTIIKYTDKQVYIFGASYNTQILISLGLNIDNIKGILDNSKEKQGKFLYGFNLPILALQNISDNTIVILKNGYYVDEISKQLREICKKVEIIT